MIVVSDGINDGTKADDYIAMLVFKLKRFNGIVRSVVCAGFAVTNVDDPAFAEVITNWDLVVDVRLGIDPV